MKSTKSLKCITTYKVFFRNDTNNKLDLLKVLTGYTDTSVIEDLL